MPVATLLEKGYLKNGDCDFPMEIGKFFSKSCVPGAKDSKYDSSGTNPMSLCSLCVGDGEINSCYIVLTSKSIGNFYFSFCFKNTLIFFFSIQFIKS